MYGYSDDDTPRWLSVLSIGTGGFAGVAIGTVCFFLATAMSTMIANALPALSARAFLALWMVILALPALAFVGLARKREALPSGRAFALCAAAAIAALYAGELTGTIAAYPWQERF